MSPCASRRFIGSRCRTRSAVLLGLLAGWAFSAEVWASPRMRCQLDQGGTSQVLEFAPVAEPYSVKAIDINGHFRFKAVVIGDERQIEYVKLYTYTLAKQRSVLLHEARYLAPAIQPGAATAAFTGQNTLYSPELEREFQYACVLFEAAP